jgi:glycosyltransferase involved in cell wall biosynthesis
VDVRSGLRVLVVIPAHNEEASIGPVLRRLREVAPSWDCVVVNDGSRDNTARVVEDLGEKQLLLPTNLGYGPALQTGMKYALQRGYQVVVSLDADGQHQPEDAPAMVRALLESNADMVIGSRFCDGRRYTSPISRRIGQLLFSHLTRLLVGQRIYDTSSGYKALHVVTCADIISKVFMDFHIETIVALSLTGRRITEHPITVHERQAGESMHSYSSIFTYPVKTLLLTLVAALDVMVTKGTR